MKDQNGNTLEPEKMEEETRESMFRFSSMVYLIVRERG